MSHITIQVETCDQAALKHIESTLLSHGVYAGITHTLTDVVWFLDFLT